MGLFSGKKKAEVIPEVAQPSYGQQQPSYSRGPASSASSTHSAAPSYRTAPSYVPPSQGGSGYAQSSHWDRPQQGQYGAPQQQQQQGSFGRGGTPQGQGQYGGGGYGAKYGDQQQQPGQQSRRDQLLSGAPPPKPGGGFGAGQSYGGGGQGGSSYGDSREGSQYGEGGQVQEEDEEVEGIKQQMRFVKQDTLASSRNAVRIAREAEETARATLDRLGDQSDRIANTERHLDLAKAHNERAVDETKELEALNRSIFRPNFTMNKAKKRDKEEQRLLARHQQEKDEREQVRRDQYESRMRMENTYKAMDRDAENAAGAKQRARARGSERARYQFEATASDDEVEDEIDDNLDQISGLAGRLKMLATAAGQEVDAQNSKLSKLGDKVDTLDNNIHRSTQRMARIK
ncbi:plasma membrane SNARE protein [Pseudohyphozyma bogoriensis]|nr:plasma membrane SNARE protein [Pseudohyphozyma bogoriensis]